MRFVLTADGAYFIRLEYVNTADVRTGMTVEIMDDRQDRWEIRIPQAKRQQNSLDEGFYIPKKWVEERWDLIPFPDNPAPADVLRELFLLRATKKQRPLSVQDRRLRYSVAFAIAKTMVSEYPV